MDITGPADWLKSLGSQDDPPKPLSLEDLQKLMKECSFGAAKPLPDCKVCEKPIGEYGIPGVGFFCRWHLPPDAVPASEEDEPPPIWQE